MNQCADCRDGEHDNYNDNVKFTIVRGEYGAFIKRAYLCAEHRQMYMDDGYEVI